MSALVLESLSAATSAPAFNASPSYIYMNANVGGPPPAHQVMVVNNSVAGTTLKWKAAITGSGASNCTVTPSTGTLSGSAGAMLTVAAKVPTTGGAYVCTITLSDNGSSPQATNTATVTVDYAVYAANQQLPPPDTTPPNLPQYLNLDATGTNAVNFVWFTGGDPSGYVAGFKVYRNGTAIAVTGLSSYQDNNVAAGTYYTYSVAAFDSSQNYSAQTPAMAVTTWAPAPKSVPSAYQSLYQGVRSSIATDYALVNAQYTGAKYPVNYSIILMSANENMGSRNSFTDLRAVDQELDAAQALGMNTVMIAVGFPMFDQNFWVFQGQTASQAQQSVQNYLGFYELVVQDIHKRKDVNGTPMKVVLESNPLLTSDNPRTNLNATPYYQSLSLAMYEQRRAACTVTAAKNLLPDYLIIQSEIDTDARDDYRSELNTPATDVAMIQTMVNDLNGANIPGLHSTIKVGSGMGAWQANWQEFLGTPGTGTGLLGITGLDNFDTHIFYLTGQSAPSGMTNELDAALQMISQAHAAGKTAGMGQFWPHKSLLSNENNQDVKARDAFNFWAPLDQQYVPLMFEMANQNSLEYLSIINDGELYGYEPYIGIPCIPVYPASGGQNVSCDLTILDTLATAVQLAITLGKDSSTGAAYQSAITQYWQAH